MDRLFPGTNVEPTPPDTSSILRPMRVAGPLVVALLAGPAIGCGGATVSPTAPTPAVSPPPPPAQRVTVSTPTPVMVVGDFQRAALATVPPFLVGAWQSSDPAVVTVDEKGGVRAVRRGRATVQHTVGGSTGSASVRVIEDHQGIWGGRYSVTACQDTEGLSESGFCSSARAGADGFIWVGWAQDGLALRGRLEVAGLGVSDVQAVTLADDDRVLFPATVKVEDVTIRLALDVRREGDRLVQTGPITMVWTQRDRAGEGRLRISIADMARTD